jgi:glyoxylase-like metal-dependent hydrolase (beta-lactamase superfamily II)
MSADLSTNVRAVAVGDLELASLPDAVGILGELGELYPEVSGGEWEPHRALYPELFKGSLWRLPVACFLVRAEERTILVDAGVGPPGSWEWEGETEGGLPRALAAHRVDLADLDAVFLTHLHIDHVGWLADEELLAHAQVLVHGAAFTFAAENSRIRWLPDRLRELEQRGRIQTVSDGAELAPGVTAQAYPGHYPGHLGLRLESHGARAVMVADAAVHPTLLDRLDWRYVSDHEHETSASTRRSLVSALADEDSIVAASHYPGSGIGRIVRRADRVIWEEIA